jgi:hypothetical protein
VYHNLIVVSTHDRPWLSRWLGYSDADEVARNAAVPVLVFRGVEAWGSGWNRECRMQVPSSGFEINLPAVVAVFRRGAV